MKRPLLLPAFLYTTGTLLGAMCPLAWTRLFVFTSLLLLLAMASPQLRRVCLVTSILLAGWCNIAARLSLLSPHDLRTVFGERTAIVAVRGTLTDTPTQRIQERKSGPAERTHAILEIRELRLHNHWQPAHGRIAITLPGVLDTRFFAGREVEVDGVLRPPPGARAEGLFDYRAYLRWQGIHHQLITDDTRDWRLLDGPSVRPPLAERFRVWAQHTLARGLPEEDEPLRLVWAMALGWKTALTDEVATPFMHSGTMHVFAISGLHIALIAGILAALLRVLRVPRAACGLVVLPLIWFYTGATGWQSSAIRSTVMMSVIIGGWALKRPCDLLNSLAGAALVILAWDPRQLFQTSFQLSFFVVLSLALLMPALEPWRQRLLQGDPLLPDSARPRWRRWLEAPLRWLSLSASVSFAAWLGSLPLIAHYFHLITPVSLLANLIIVPLSSLELMCNLGSLLCGDWWPWLGGLFNHAGWLWMLWMDRVSEWCTRLPGAYFYVRAPTAIELTAYYTLLFGAALGMFAQPRGRRWLSAALAVLAAIWLWQWQNTRNQIELTILGNCIHFDVPNRANDLLVDAGDANSAGFVTGPFLRTKGVNRLPSLVLTHGDIRHYGGVNELEKEFSLADVRASPATSSSRGYRELIARLKKTPGRVSFVQRGERLGAWRVLHPAATDRFPRGDDNVIVLHGEFHSARVLLLSDLGAAGQAALLARETDLRADIVVAGIPTQDEPLTEELLDAIRPQLVVIADSKVPAKERAAPPLRRRLAARALPVLYVSDVDAVTLTFHLNGWEARAMNGERFIFPAHPVLQETPASVAKDPSPNPPR